MVAQKAKQAKVLKVDWKLIERLLGRATRVHQTCKCHCYEERMKNRDLLSSIIRVQEFGFWNTKRRGDSNQDSRTVFLFRSSFLGGGCVFNFGGGASLIWRKEGRRSSHQCVGIHGKKPQEGQLRR